MEPSGVALCALVVALRWPNRIPDLQKLIPAFPSVDPVHRLLWETTIRCWTANRSLSASMLQEQVVFDIQYRTPAYMGLVRDWIRAVAASQSLTEIYCMGVLKQYAEEQLRQQMSATTPDRMAPLVAQWNVIQQTAVSSSFQARDFFANDGRDVLSTGTTLPLGLWFLDEPFGGLPPLGTTWLYVMPSKAGKTLMSLQITRAMVNLQQSVLYMNFEQEARGNIGHRIFTVQSGLPIDIWRRAASLSDVDANARATLMAAKPAWDRYAKILTADELCNPETPVQGIAGVQKIVEDLYLNQGQPPPALIILDWWRRLWDTYKAYLLLTNPRISDGELLHQETENLLKLRRLASTLNTRIAVFQQMRSALAGSATNIEKIQAQDTADNKSLVNVVDAVFVTTRKNARDNTMSIKLADCRFTDNNWTSVLQMDGALQQFRPYNSAEDSYIVPADTEANVIADMQDEPG